MRTERPIRRLTAAEMGLCDAEDWRVVVRAEHGTGPVMTGNERQCRAVARSLVGMSVNDGAGVSLGQVIEARAEPVPAANGGTPCS